MITESNGCAHTHAGRLASAMGLVGAINPKSKAEEEPSIEAANDGCVTCNTGFFRAQPQDLFDLCAMGGKTVEIYWDLGRPQSNSVPSAVLIPGARYAELIALEAKIRSMAGKFGPG